jgi:hypothetical protein
LRAFQVILAASLLASAGRGAQQSGTALAVTNLTGIRRIYVSELIGANADQLRELIIASLDSTKLFVLTDNVDRADAILKGAADDKVFTDSVDIQEGISARQNLSKGSSGSSSSSRGGGAYGGISISDSQSHHSKERKHEAYATVRLCNKDGDVLWSTTQESLGAKFRGASADVASKIARQLTLDMEREQHPAAEETSKQ